jgi:integrase
MLPQHTKITSNGVYKYRRRTPLELKGHIGFTEIIKSLGKNQEEAIKKAAELSQGISEAIQLTKLASVPSSVISSLLEKHFLIPINDCKVPTKEINTLVEVATLYLSSLTVSLEEVRDRKYILLELFPSIFQIILQNSNPSLLNIKYSSLVKAREILQYFPKRNIEKYRQIPTVKIVQMIHENTLALNQEQYVSSTTVNKYLKWLNALISFAIKQGIIPYTQGTSGLAIRKTINARGQRKEFTQDELFIIDQAFQYEAIYPIFNILRYTGMRFSELLKCSISEINGVMCFDLRTPTKPLKTLSSHRIIPIHPNIKDCIGGFQELINSYSQKYLTKKFTIIIHRHLEDTKSKSLYSLRHTFATTLIAKGVMPEIVSELMGHSHNTMTLNRYVKGFPIGTLKSAIDTL